MVSVSVVYTGCKLFIPELNLIQLHISPVVGKGVNMFEYAFINLSIILKK